MRYRIVCILALTLGLLTILAQAKALCSSSDTVQTSTNDLVKFSEELLLAVRYEESTDSLLIILAETPLQQLLDELNTDTKKVAFWVNIYNASYQILYKDLGLRPDGIFNEKAITIASVPFSLDDMEHGVLRKYRHKYSLGYMPMWFPASHIKKLAVEEINWRIHFALNCGAISCPPIAFYDAEQLEHQLELATASFLGQEIVINEETKTLEVTKIMFWFKGDFGGKDGIRKIVGKVFNRDFHDYNVQFQEYDWTAKLDYFVE